LSGKVGQTVDYQIVVKDTGNTSLVFATLSDAKCASIEPSGSVTLAAGESKPSPCVHVLDSSDQAAGFHENCATATATPPVGSSITHASNCVVVNIPPEPAFTIEKRQEIAGSNAGFTTSPLSGKVGQTVDYQIVVKDTGNTSLVFATLSDAKCASIEPSGSVTLAAGESKTYPCVHVLDSSDQAAGFHENCATATATPPVGSSITHASNCVVVNIPPEPAFPIEKRQEIAGSNAGFTTSPLSGKVGQTVDYQIVVKDTGNTSLVFATLSDAKCASIEPSGSVTLAAGESKTYPCVHVLDSSDQAAGFHENCATATATPPVGSSITHASNCVVVTVPPPPTPHTGVLPITTVAPALAGPQGCVRGGAVISIKAAGVSSVTFYLD